MHVCVCVSVPYASFSIGTVVAAPSFICGSCKYRRPTPGVHSAHVSWPTSREHANDGLTGTAWQISPPVDGVFLSTMARRNALWQRELIKKTVRQLSHAVGRYSSLDIRQRVYRVGKSICCWVLSSLLMQWNQRVRLYNLSVDIIYISFKV